MTMPIFAILLGLVGAWRAWTDATTANLERQSYVGLPLLGAAFVHLFP